VVFSTVLTRNESNPAVVPTIPTEETGSKGMMSDVACDGLLDTWNE
jgi:hypothetical protein